MKTWQKIVAACVASWVFLGAITLMLASMDIFGSGASIGQLLLVLLIAWLSCYSLAWVNTHSLRQAALGALGGMLLGLPLGFLILAPLGDRIARTLFPLSSLDVSGSLSLSWFFLGVVASIEIFTDRIRHDQRWLRLLTGSLVVMLIIYSASLWAAPFGIKTNTELIKLILYAPVIWGSIVAAVNVRTSNQSQAGKGENNEQHQ